MISNEQRCEQCVNNAAIERQQHDDLIALENEIIELKKQVAKMEGEMPAHVVQKTWRIEI